MCTLFVAIVTGVARDGDVFVMYTVVNAPAVVTTAYNVSLCAITLNVVQPYLTSTGTVALTNELSTVSACNGTYTFIHQMTNDNNESTAQLSKDVRSKKR